LSKSSKFFYRFYTSLRLKHQDEQDKILQRKKEEQALQKRNYRSRRKEEQKDEKGLKGSEKKKIIPSILEYKEGINEIKRKIEKE